MLQLGDALQFYKSWPTPMAIISDGPYAVKFDWDNTTIDSLANWYQPHIDAWSKASNSQTTLWFWNTEIGWANVHPILESFGWVYRGLNIWNKGHSHLAGNINTVTIRKFPVVTEVCAHYIRKAEVQTKVGNGPTPQDWLRLEWIRTGLPLSESNVACGVKNAASRKYLTADHMWYFPPAEQFDKMAKYANTHGNQDGKPYFSVDGQTVLQGDKWETLRAKFKCPFGWSNVWSHPTVRGPERIKNDVGIVHPNQKPLALFNMLIDTSTDVGDIVWEPFAGLATGLASAKSRNRRGYGAEIDKKFFEMASFRLSDGIMFEKGEE